MKEIKELIEPIEAEYIVFGVLHWIAMRHFGLWDNGTFGAFGGSELATYIDEAAIILSILIASNLLATFVLQLYKLYKLYKEWEPQKPTWETYEPQMQDLREAYDMGNKIIKRWETPKGKNYAMREIETDEGTVYQMLKE